MSYFFPNRKKEERAVSITQNPTAAQLVAFYGMSDFGNLPAVSVKEALRVPAVLAAVTFLSRTLSSLDRKAYKKTASGDIPIGGKLGIITSEAPNPEWSAAALSKYFWQQVFTHGRGLMYIERRNGQPDSIWPMDSSNVSVRIEANGTKNYYAGERVYSGADIIDVPFMLQDDQVSVFSPISRGAAAIRLALAMETFASGFFAGGGVPPLALTGPMPSGADAVQRAMNDVHRAIDAARRTDKPVFPLPPDYKLEPVGFDPEKGQMTEARRFQIEEIARVYQLPPVFLQDLTHGTFTNTEQQDLHLSKHVVSQWAGELEQEMNLKIFGQTSNRRFIRHDLNSLMRGDFPSRIDGLVKGVQGGVFKPNEARAKEGLPAEPNGDDLMIQGATVAIGTQGDQSNDA